jgi:DNA invertase Pin-like site-specific DNA recombinase
MGRKFKIEIDEDYYPLFVGALESILAQVRGARVERGAMSASRASAGEKPTAGTGKKGRRKRGQRLNEEDKDQIVALYSKFGVVAQVAKRIGSSDPTVKKVLEDRGISTGRGGGKRRKKKTARKKTAATA